MKVLIVCSKTKGKIAPFILEQIESLVKNNIKIDLFTIENKGIIGYLKSLPFLIKKIKDFKPDIVHAHYGLSGLLAVLQRKVPVCITFHGSDIHNRKNLKLSKIAIKLSKVQIFVTDKLKQIASCKQGIVLPCGVDTSIFYYRDREMMKEKFFLSKNKNYVLFSSSFDREIKNSLLAMNAVKEIDNCELLELNNFSRLEVAELMNAVDVCLLTSFDEGSPQFIKEALASCTPIVTTNVGDVRNNIDDVNGCYLTSFSVEECRNKILEAIKYRQTYNKTDGDRMVKDKNLSLDNISSKLIHLYNEICIKLK